MSSETGIAEYDRDWASRQLLMAIRHACFVIGIVDLKMDIARIASSFGRHSTGDYTYSDFQLFWRRKRQKLLKRKRGRFFAVRSSSTDSMTCRLGRPEKVGWRYRYGRSIDMILFLCLLRNAESVEVSATSVVVVIIHASVVEKTFQLERRPREIFSFSSSRYSSK